MYGAQIFSIILRDLPQLHWFNTIASDALLGDLPSMRGVCPGLFSLSADLQTMSKTNASKQK